MTEFYPEGAKVVIEPDSMEERIGKIIVPQTVRDKHQHAQQMGTIVAVGPTANTLVYDPDYTNDKGEHTRPIQVGDRVMIIKHSFVQWTDKETKKELWLVYDDDILGVEK